MVSGQEFVHMSGHETATATEVRSEINRVLREMLSQNPGFYHFAVGVGARAEHFFRGPDDGPAGEALVYKLDELANVAPLPAGEIRRVIGEAYSQFAQRERDEHLMALLGNEDLLALLGKEGPLTTGVSGR